MGLSVTWSANFTVTVSKFCSWCLLCLKVLLWLLRPHPEIE